MNRKFKSEKENDIFKKLFQFEDTKFSKEEGETILNVLKREKIFISDETDLSYINGSIKCLERDNCIINPISKQDLRHALYTIFYSYIVKE